MGDGASLTLQIHHHGAWHDAADLAVADVRAGIRSSTRFDYDPFYFIAFGNAEFAAGRPETARAHGVPEPIIARAFAACGELAAALAALPAGDFGKGRADAAP